MSKSKEFYEAVIQVVANRVPGFEVRYKNESRWQKVLGFFVKPFNRSYMTKMTTTLYPRVYYPSRKFVEENYTRAAWTALHEFVHLLDHKDKAFTLRYALPQVLALLSLLVLGAFWFSWFLLALGFLVAAAPWPSPTRTSLELRGYSMDMALEYWTKGYITSTTKANLIYFLTGWPYYRMCGSKKRATELVDQREEQIKSGHILVGADASAYRLAYKILKTSNMLAVR